MRARRRSRIHVGPRRLAFVRFALDRVGSSCFHECSGAEATDGRAALSGHPGSLRRPMRLVSAKKLLSTTLAGVGLLMKTAELIQMARSGAMAILLAIPCGCGGPASPGQPSALSPPRKVSGTVGETLSDGAYSAEIEKIVQDMDVSPYSRTVGQKSLTFHVLVINPGSSPLVFDEVVMFTLGENEQKHVNTFSEGQGGTGFFTVEGSKALRVLATTPESSVPKAKTFVVGIKHKGKAIGEPLTFDVSAAKYELSPTLQMIGGARQDAK